MNNNEIKKYNEQLSNINPKFYAQAILIRLLISRWAFITRLMLNLFHLLLSFEEIVIIGDFEC